MRTLAMTAPPTGEANGAKDGGQRERIKQRANEQGKADGYAKGHGDSKLGEPLYDWRRLQKFQRAIKKKKKNDKRAEDATGPEGGF